MSLKVQFRWRWHTQLLQQGRRIPQTALEYYLPLTKLMNGNTLHPGYLARRGKAQEIGPVLDLPGPFQSASALIAMVAGGTEIVPRSVWIPVLERFEKLSQFWLIVNNTHPEIHIFIFKYVGIVFHQHFQLAVEQLQPVLLPLKIHDSPHQVSTWHEYPVSINATGLLSYPISAVTGSVVLQGFLHG